MPEETKTTAGKKFLYANGCSWTAGNGIEHDPVFAGMSSVDAPLRLWKNLSWPSILARMLSADHHNFAIGGGSNQRMVRMTCDFLRNWPAEQRDQLLVVLGWTSCERREVSITYNGRQAWQCFNPWQDPRRQLKNTSSRSTTDEILPEHVVNDIAAYHELNSRYFIDHQESTERFLREVWMMANILENLRIPFLFFSSINGIGFPGEEAKLSPIMASTLEMMKDDRFLGMGQGETMMSWCNKNGFDFSPCHHPMIKSHAAWAKHLFNAYKRLYKNDDNTEDR